VGGRDVNQDSDSLQRVPSVELMRRRRDAWRDRAQQLERELKLEQIKVRRLEREMVIAEANRETLEIMRCEMKRLRAVIADQHSALCQDLDQQDGEPYS
jgi:hypothetical protein